MNLEIHQNLKDLTITMGVSEIDRFRKEVELNGIGAAIRWIPLWDPEMGEKECILIEALLSQVGLRQVGEIKQ